MDAEKLCQLKHCKSLVSSAKQETTEANQLGVFREYFCFRTYSTNRLPAMYLPYNVNRLFALRLISYWYH